VASRASRYWRNKSRSGRLRLRRQQIDSQPRRPDIVDFFGHELSPRVEARRGTGERERNQQPEQCKDCTFHGPRTGARAFGVGDHPAPAESSSCLDREQHARKQGTAKQRHERQKVWPSALHAIYPARNLLLIDSMDPRRSPSSVTPSLISDVTLDSMLEGVRVMIAHISLAVSNYSPSKAFYTRRSRHSATRTTWNTARPPVSTTVKNTDFWIAKKATVVPSHVAFEAKDREQVAAFHKAALAAGGKDNGGPGYRTEYWPGYYASFVYDPTATTSRRSGTTTAGDVGAVGVQRGAAAVGDCSMAQDRDQVVQSLVGALALALRQAGNAIVHGRTDDRHGVIGRATPGRCQPHFDRAAVLPHALPHDQPGLLRAASACS
jgi:catechol 2,3-dioxygenase-like lactoylglutathione lyase family enzyme